MSDIAAFLTARYDEDEALAHSVKGNGLFDGTGIVVMKTHLPSQSRSVTLPSHVATYAATFDPAYVLADIAAKRAILAAYDSMANDWTHFDQTEGEHAREYALREVVRHLTSVYADHSDYKEDWKP